MKKNLFTLMFIAPCLFAAPADQWKLVWSDEFNYTGLPEKTKWGYDVGCTGWGNQELQAYTKDSLANAKVEGGTLVITARKGKSGTCDYSSARLVTKNKGDWLYGRFEIAAKLPAGRGLWPAIWMLPTDNAYGGWPKSGELDIMENVGFDPNNIFFTVHTEAYNHSIGTSKGTSKKLDDPSTKFNVYALEWYEDRVDFFANEAKVFTFKNEATGSKVWPFDKRFHLLLNIAVGGSWGGQKGVDDTIFPQSMIIDYVRVYEQNALGVSSEKKAGAREEQPLFFREKSRLMVRKNGAQDPDVRLFSMNGKLLSADRSQTPGSGCAVILPPGACIAVIQYGSSSRIIPFAAVD